MGEPILAGAVAVAYLARQVDVLKVQQEPVRADAHDAVHKARVATRRARSALRVWRPLFHPGSTEDLRGRLAWYGEQLGRPRDTEVLRGHMADLFEATGVDGRAERRVLGELKVLHEASHGLLVATMASSRYELLMAMLSDFVADPPVAESGLAVEVLPPLVGAAAARVERQRQAALALDEPAAILMWHEVRKSAKAVRYAVEAIRDAFGDEFGPLAKAWERVTDELGLLQDAAIVAELLEPIAAVAVRAGESGASYEALSRAQAALSAGALVAGRRAVEEALVEIDSLPGLLRVASAG